MSDDEQRPQSRQFSLEAVGDHIGSYVVVYDPYRVEKARRQIARYDTARMVDTPNAKVVVLIPTLRQHIESGSHVDMDVLRHGVDVVGVYDSDSVRRVTRALNGSGVRVVLLPQPKTRDIMNYETLSDKQKIPGMAAVLQTMYDITPSEARAAATEILARKAEKNKQ